MKDPAERAKLLFDNPSAIFIRKERVMTAIEQLRTLEAQGRVERVDLEDTGGDPSAIVRNVRAREEEEIETRKRLLSEKTDPGDRQS